MSRVAASPVVTMLACFFHLAREAMGAGYRTRTFPAPSLSRRHVSRQSLGRENAPRDCGRVSVSLTFGLGGAVSARGVIASASEAIQSPRRGLDCFVACAPRNDGAGVGGMRVTTAWGYGSPPARGRWGRMWPPRRARQRSSFRGDAQHRTRNLEIPGLALARHPGMTGAITHAARR